jgi:hypothetical protein
MRTRYDVTASTGVVPNECEKACKSTAVEAEGETDGQIKADIIFVNSQCGIYLRLRFNLGQIFIQQTGGCRTHNFWTACLLPHTNYIFGILRLRAIN